MKHTPVSNHKFYRNKPHFRAKFSLLTLSLFSVFSVSAFADVSDADFAKLKQDFETIQAQFNQLKANGAVKLVQMQKPTVMSQLR